MAIVPGLDEFKCGTTIRPARDEVPVRVSGRERATQSVTHGVFAAVARGNHGVRDDFQRLQPLSRGSSCALTTPVRMAYQATDRVAGCWRRIQGCLGERCL
jgi:hypothetical protein